MLGNIILAIHYRVCLKILVKQDEQNRAQWKHLLMRFSRTGKKWGKSRSSIVLNLTETEKFSQISNAIHTLFVSIHVEWK